MCNDFRPLQGLHPTKVMLLLMEFFLCVGGGGGDIKIAFIIMHRMETPKLWERQHHRIFKKN